MISHRSGRPVDGEFAAYAKGDIDFVVGDDISKALKSISKKTSALFRSMNETFASSFRYAPGKWAAKEVLGHLVDDERVFSYRILCVARADFTPLPGFDENEYVSAANFESRSLESLLAEYSATRASTLALLGSFSPVDWLRRGKVNDYQATVRGLSFHVAGHELHHLRVISDKYLPHQTPSR